MCMQRVRVLYVYSLTPTPPHSVLHSSSIMGMLVYMTVPRPSKTICQLHKYKVKLYWMQPCNDSPPDSSHAFLQLFSVHFLIIYILGSY